LSVGGVRQEGTVAEVFFYGFRYKRLRLRLCIAYRVKIKDETDPMEPLDNRSRYIAETQTDLKISSSSYECTRNSSSIRINDKQT
jgi:hypothetical protein